MSPRISLASVLAMLLLGAPALADEASCRDAALPPETRAPACAAAAATVQEAAGRAELLELQARALLFAGDPEAAEAPIRAAIRLVPTAADSLTTLAQVLRARGDHDGAQALLSEAMALDPANPRPLVVATMNLADQGEFGACVGTGDRALALDPTFALAWALRGRCLDNLRRAEEAARDFQQAISLGLDEAWVQDNLSLTLFKLDRFDEALEAARRAVALDPGHAGARVSLMTALAATGQPDAAVAAYHEAEDLGLAEEQDAANQLAWTLYEQGESALALPIIETWVEAHPDPGPEGAAELDTYAHVLAALGRPEEAAEAWLRAAGTSLGDSLHFARRLSLLGFANDGDLGPAFLACARTGMACRLND